MRSDPEGTVHLYEFAGFALIASAAPSTVKRIRALYAEVTRTRPVDVSKPKRAKRRRS